MFGKRSDVFDSRPLTEKEIIKRMNGKLKYTRLSKQDVSYLKPANFKKYLVSQGNAAAIQDGSWVQLWENEYDRIAWSYMN